MLVQTKATLRRLHSAWKVRSWLYGGLVVLVVLSLISATLIIRHRSESLLPAPQNLSPLPGQQQWSNGVSSFLFGTNDTYEWSDQNIETSTAIQEAIRAAGFTLLRTFFPNDATDTQIDQRIATVKNSGAQCLGVITNVEDATFDEHLVRYFGQKCLMYEFGNEPDFNGISAETYLNQWNTLIPQLRTINPSAKFIGPATSTDTGDHDFMRVYLGGVKASGVLPDAISFHWYPCFNDSEAACLSKVGSYADAATRVRTLVKSILGKEVPVGITEWNYDPGNPPPAYGDNASFITAFTVAAIRAMASAGVMFACQFDAASYSGYGRLDMFDVATGQPKPQYTALKKLIASYRPTSTSGSTSPAVLLSLGRPVYCSEQDTGPGGSGALVDGHFGNWGFWQSDVHALPSWCAMQLARGPTQVLVAWFSDYDTDYVSPAGLGPADYTLSVSANSTNGADGTWRTVATVTDNHARAREQVVPFSGDSWVKMTVSKGQPQASQPYIFIDELEVYDASAGGKVDDSFFFSGDSITAMAYNRFDENAPSFANDVHAALPSEWPLTIDGGFAGADSGGALQDIDLWLTLTPDIHYWLVEWGTNDAFNQVAPEAFKANLQTLIDAIKAAGHVPILARIPPVNLPSADQSQRVNNEIDALNQVIDGVTTANGLTAGPDMHALFSAHLSTYLLPDGIHPTPAGAVAMNNAWFETLLPLL